MKVVFAVGTRPDIVKMAPVIRAYGPSAMVVYTGQHYSPALGSDVLQEFGIEINRHLMHGHQHSVGELFGPLVASTRRFCHDHWHGCMVVYGDTLSASAVAMGAKLAGWKVAHVEAGLRSRNLTMPEEVARMHIDAVSDYLFAPTDEHLTNLDLERTQGLCMKTGNTIQDVLKGVTRDNEGSNIAVLTLHRRENQQHFKALLEGVLELADVMKLDKVIWPMHPSMTAWKELLGGRIITPVDPMGHGEFLSLMTKASIVFTDSGGLQEECAIIGVPCLCLRDTTERPETVKSGWVKLYHPHLPGWGVTDDVVDWHWSCEELLPYRYDFDNPSEIIASFLKWQLPKTL